MNISAIVEFKLEECHVHNQEYKSQVEALDSTLQDAVIALSKVTEEERKTVYAYDNEYRDLKRQQDFWKSFTAIPHDAPYVVGEYFDWPHYWFLRLLKGSINVLSRIPYKQCGWCGKSYQEKGKRAFCSLEHHAAFRIWRDYSRQIGKSMSESERYDFYLKRALTLYDQNSPPHLQSVLEAAERLAQKLTDQLFGYLKEEEIQSPVEYARSVQPHRHKITAKLLKHYHHRRQLPPETAFSLSSLTEWAVTPKDRQDFLSPKSYLTDALLILKPKNRTIMDVS